MSPQINEYTVGFYHTEVGTTVVKAVSEQDAIMKLHKQLEMNGTDELDFDIKDREYDVTGLIDFKGVQDA